MFFQIIMKILPKLSYDYFIQQNSKSKLCQSNTTAQKTTAADLNNIPHYIHTISRVSFLGNISEQTNAQNYLNTQKANLNSKNIKNIDISCFDLEKLEGIQSGIKIFDGLNMKEIAFITTNLLEIAVNRGCYNNCAHCYAEGLPPLKETEKQTSKMGWENFKSLCNGFKELNNRLGFNIFNPDSYMTAFHDADCSQIYLEDKDGNIVAIHATYDPESKGGTTPDGRKVKGTSHWVSATECISAEVRQYDKLFKAENPGAATGNYLDDLNPESLIIIKDAKIEKEAASAKPGDYLQFIRNGYYMADCRDSSPEHLVFNRTVTLKDSWSKMKQKMGI